MSEYSIMAYVNNLFIFYKSAYYVKFLFNTDCILPVFYWNFTR